MGTRTTRDEDDRTCGRCGCDYTLREGYDLTSYCDQCAQTILLSIQISHDELLRACKHALYLLGNDKDRKEIAKEIGDPPWKPRDATSVPGTLRDAIDNSPMMQEEE